MTDVKEAPAKKPMSKRALKALKASIKHWENLPKSTCNDFPSARHCALCRLYNNEQEPKNCCMGCPIYKVTGEAGCECTPYTVAAKVFWDRGRMSPAFKKHSKLQLLETLVPAGHG